MTPSASFETALARTRRQLLEPFDPRKYLGIALWTWLSGLGGLSLRSTSTPSHSPDLHVDPAVLAAGATVALVVGAVVLVLLLFVQTRATFALIDDLVRDRGAVKEAWTSVAEPANALFRFRLGVLGGAAVMAAVAGAAGLALVWSGAGGPWTVLAAVGLGVPTAIVGLAAGLVDTAAREFVAPLVYVRGYRPADGFRDLWDRIRADTGGFVTWVVLRIVAGIGVGVVWVLAIVFTCGLAAVPFVGTALILPAEVFLRLASLQYLSGWGDDLAALGA